MCYYFCEAKHTTPNYNVLPPAIVTCVKYSTPQVALPQLVAFAGHQSSCTQCHEDEAQGHREMCQTQTHPLFLFLRASSSSPLCLQ